MKKYYKFSIYIAFIILFLTGCNVAKEVSVSEAGENHKVLQIYTTLYPLTYFTEQIGGEHVEVESILPLGADAHTYEPTSKTMVEIAKADGFIYNGAQMEAYAGSIKEALKDEGVTVLEASKGIPLLEHKHHHSHVEENDHDHGHHHNEMEEEEETHHHDHGQEDHETEEHTQEHQESHNHDEEPEEHHHNHGDKDPHVWLDPNRAITIAENIKDLLVELQPEAEAEFENNFTDLKSKLEELNKSYHEKIQAQSRNEILVTHAAYGYWEEAYGIKQIAISGLSPSNEPSQQQLVDVINIVDDHEINYLLFEQNVEPKVAKVIQNETNVKSLDLHNLSVLTEEDIQNEQDYFSLMYQNLDALITALKE